MYARIHDGVVAELMESTPQLATGECARIVEVGPDVQIGWRWTPEGCSPFPVDELAAAVRAERAARLTACDWTQLPDAPLSAEQRAAWAAYRQALRDVPEQAGFPLVVEWPVEPGV